MNKPQTVKKKSWNKKQFIFYLTCFDFKNALLNLVAICMGRLTMGDNWGL